MNNGISNTLPVKGVILDMDGTLIDSTEADFLAWQRVFADYDLTLTMESYFPLLGMKSEDVARKALHLEGDAVKAALAQKLEYFKQVVIEKGINPVPFADTFLKNISSYPVKMALATSSRNPKMTMVMTRLGFLDYFDATVTGEEVINGKPAPDIFLKAAERLGLDPQDCMVVEDAVSGVTAAKAAAMKCLAITTTHSAERLVAAHADLVLESFEQADLKKVLEAMNGHHA